MATYECKKCGMSVNASCAKCDAPLIDDYIKNIKEWEKKGGIGVHHTEVGKTLAELKRLGFK